ncbi:MAG: hypothetical protein ABJG68_08845 [Crocinitomicaceae bacterium]
MGFKEKIDAVYILQRFVRMSRILLPTYLEFKAKVKLTGIQQERFQRIVDIYDNFKADPAASKYLINSNIIGLIQKVYRQLSSENGITPEIYHEYNAFLKESDRLISDWDKQILN